MKSRGLSASNVTSVFVQVAKEVGFHIKILRPSSVLSRRLAWLLNL